MNLQEKVSNGIEEALIRRIFETRPSRLDGNTKAASEELAAVAIAIIRPAVLEEAAKVAIDGSAIEPEVIAAAIRALGQEIADK